MIWLYEANVVVTCLYSERELSFQRQPREGMVGCLRGAGSAGGA